ncbi:hypothetical protein M758_7G156400 [Ceratodon purpureus]|uniref:EXPERA domain-containing protein n=1 Tax=Ceratodon purpureus TaxID=3225 RepID=A0A8T0H8U6_CERPU|nr:hypothetical protein KC19_7G121800 [Ceratodon purpureus]KAG0611662.1 hypothetical protein M758_7G156400 [Ceratodon purpureus]
MGVMEAAHPYMPVSMELPGFHPALMSQAFILATYGGASAVVVLIVWLLSGSVAKLRTVDRLLMCWFAFSGLTHIILEGYFVFTPDFFTFTKPHLLAEVWKEYSKADSRYVGRDPTVVVIEGITAVLAGPGCLLAVYAIATKPVYEHTLQLVVSTAQLYGDIVYFATVILKGVEICLPGPVYYWFYYIFMNGIWVVIPLLISFRSWGAINRAFASTKKKSA